MMQPDLPWGIYIRTSTFEQAEKSSPLKQYVACAGWAKANGKTIPGLEAALINNRVQRGDFVFLDHQTGTNDKRPDWQRFMAAAAAGKIGGIVCYVVDRAARNLADAVKIQRDLKRMRVGFQFAQQNFDDTPGGTLMFQMFAAFAEYEVQIIHERTHDGIRKRILGTGKKDSKPRVQGPPLYGYHLEDGIPVEDAKEGPIARLYLRLALDGKTSGAIARELNEAGYRTRQGKLWGPTMLARSLRKAFSYAGVYRHRHGINEAIKARREAVDLMGANAPGLDLSSIEILETAPYPPLITREEANLILGKAEKNRLMKRGQPTKKYALSHYLWCSRCQCRWYAKRGVYRCGCTQRGKPHCGVLSITQDRMEAAVLDGMRNYLKQPEVHYALAMRDYNATRGASKMSGADLEKKLRALAKEQAHYDEQATAYDLSPKQREIAKKKAAQLERQAAEVSAELRRLATVTPLPSEAGIVAAFGQMLAILDRIETFAERREFVEATIRRVDTDGREVKVQGALDIAADNATYSNRHQSTGFNKSNSIPFAFSAAIPARRKQQAA